MRGPSTRIPNLSSRKTWLNADAEKNPVDGLG